MFKEFAVTERHRMLLRGEGFNWLNHPNWGGFDSNPPQTPRSAKVTGKSDQRKLQVSLRL